MKAAAVGGIFALIAIAVVLALGPAASTTDAERTDALTAELRCPDCQGLSVADSQTAAAREIRRQVEELVAAGATDAQVRQHFTARYGDWILLAPANPLVWIVPFAAVIGGLGVLLAWLVARRADPAPVARPPTEQQRRRVHDEAEALDA